MAGFVGGSAWKMAEDIIGGYVLLSSSTLKPFELSDLRTLAFELDKLQRAIRGEEMDLNDMEGVKTRNRKIQRIGQALMVMRAHAMKRWKATF